MVFNDLNAYNLNFRRNLVLFLNHLCLRLQNKHHRRPLCFLLLPFCLQLNRSKLVLPSFQNINLGLFFMSVLKQLHGDINLLNLFLFRFFLPFFIFILGSISFLNNSQQPNCLLKNSFLSCLS